MINHVELLVGDYVLRGMLQFPDEGEKFPLVILCHGFTGSRGETHGIFVKFSRILCENGWASLRFDFSGSGESDGTFSGATFQSELTEASAILDYAKMLHMVDSERIVVLGQSMGGAVAGALAGCRPDELAGLILWTPAGELKDTILRVMELFGAKGPFDGSTDVDCQGNLVGAPFFSELQTVDVFSMSEGYVGPVLLVWGTNDVLVHEQCVTRYGEIYRENMEYKPIVGASHGFESVAWETDLFNSTMDFLLKNGR